MSRRAVLLPLLLLLVGCWTGDQTIHQAGQRVGETVADFAKGVGSGVDNRLEVPVELSEPVSKLGLRKTVAKASGLDDDRKKTMTIYFIASQSVKTWLLAKALNSEGEEVGRSTVEVELAADDAAYVTFAFDRQMDTQLVHKYVVEIGKPVSPKTQKPAQEAPAGAADSEG